MLYKLFFVSSVIALSLGDQVNQNKEQRELTATATATLTRRLLGYESNNGGTSSTRRLLEVDLTRGIIGEDGRTQITGASPDYTKWAGIISCPSCTENDEDIHDIRDDCSAVLIAPYWVLTAAHCFYQYNLPNGKANFFPNASVFQFHPATINEETFQADPVNVVSYSIYQEFTDNDKGWNSNYDIAWVQLDRPVGDKYGYLAVGYLEFTDEPITEIMNNVGYPKDKPYPNYLVRNYTQFNEELLHTKWSQHCSIDNTYSEYNGDELIWSPDCDIFHGQSGSPLYTNDHQIVGVASLGGMKINGVVTHNGFTRITPEIQDRICAEVGWQCNVWRQVY